ncbi:regulatory protein RecX [Flexivirga meconopsidis]|uniref:regulatory protein RecX n=1 Tax=Flexivirga meconopsidis TaxID=2977121 RepID=UPI00223F5A7F|nr:regulatory protein RecX [Flexivirga meconopsidis]
MKPFDTESDSLPDFVDPADVPERPTSAAASSGPATGANSRRRVEWSGERSPAKRGRGGRGSRSGQRRRDREPPADNPDAEPDPHEVARTIVLRQLTMAPRSRKQLADKLRQRGCTDEVATEVLDRMEEVGLIDDAAYAGMLVRSQQASRGLARRALQQELRRKGVDEEIAREQLDEIDEESERDRARALVDKKLRSMHGLDATVQTRRLAGMLARKGYSSSIAWSVIREAIADAPEHQPD